MRHPHVLQLIMDSLRYWVTEMHVDGFRFDLAATLARQFHEVDRLSAFFDLVQQDPVVSQVKLIAEPWDVGEGGYQVGNFPPLWTEWNGKYRDTVRDFWRGEPATLGEFASRLTGSSDLYEHSRPPPVASASTSSPPTTASPCATWCPTTRSTTRPTARATATARAQPVLELRRRGRRPTTRRVLALRGPPAAQLPRHAAAVPGRADDLRHGDELGRTQRGNNNAYCQDNEISWVDWELPGAAELPSSPARVVRAAHRPPGLPPPPVLPGDTPGDGPALPRHGVVRAGRPSR